MAKIHTLKISNFRCIDEFEHTFGKNPFVCIIGRGDSGKSTILDAISLVLSPSWNLSFFDTDFHGLQIHGKIVIEAILYDLPETLLRDNSFGLYQRFLNEKTWLIEDEAEDNSVGALTIFLEVNKDLEPKWFVTNGRSEPEEIRSKDRAQLNVFMVSDYVDRHFAWSRGGPLYSLLKQDNVSTDDENVIVESMRAAKEKIDAHTFDRFESTIEKVKSAAANLGVSIAEVSTTIDLKDISIRDGRITLHDERIPFRLKGRGSKRLISIAIQRELAMSGGIVLIDELEIGLEPDRAQHLSRTLKQSSKGQTFITTHSRDVAVELTVQELYLMRRGAKSLMSFPANLQGCVRKSPEAFFAERILLCEGHTEMGFVRALNEYRIQNGKANLAEKGIRIANGGGGSQESYAKDFHSAGYPICYLTDSDLGDAEVKKRELEELGIFVSACEKGNSIEQQVFSDLPWEGVLELVAYAEKTKGEVSVLNSVQEAFKEHGKLDTSWKDSECPELRLAVGEAAKSKGGSWFKRIDHGEFLGQVCLKHLVLLGGKPLGEQIEAIFDWIDNA